MKILAAIVTYNRMALLERCIDHIRAQKRPPDGLLVINNSSPDGTVGMLERKGVDFVTQPNVGSAGGWNRSISEAIARGYDAVWLMDDDGYPHEDALGVLERTLSRPGLSCACSIVVRENQPTHFVFPFPVLDRDGHPILFARKRKIETVAELEKVAEDGAYRFAHLFNGALVKTEAVARLGNVDTNFFLMGDEVDFLMRLINERSIVSHTGAKHFHPDVAGRPLDRAKFYYFVKNTIILNRRYFNQPALRNAMAVAVALARTARRNSVGEALSYVAGRRAPLLWKAVRRGFRGQLGNDIDA